MREFSITTVANGAANKSWCLWKRSMEKEKNTFLVLPNNIRISKIYSNQIIHRYPLSLHRCHWCSLWCGQLWLWRHHLNSLMWCDPATGIRPWEFLQVCIHDFENNFSNIPITRTNNWIFDFIVLFYSWNLFSSWNW